MNDLINMGEVLMGLQDIRAMVWGYDIPHPTVPEYVEHHKQMQEILRRIDLHIAYFETGGMSTGWIPCSERLPDHDEMVLVTCQPKKGPANVNRAYYADGYWHGSGSMSGVVAWMPLPEPYKGGQEVWRNGNGKV